jgi:hypothetical protein
MSRRQRRDPRVGVAMSVPCRAPIEVGRTRDQLGITWVMRCVCLGTRDADDLCPVHRGLARSIEDVIKHQRAYAESINDAVRYEAVQ